MGALPEIVARLKFPPRTYARESPTIVRADGSHLAGVPAMQARREGAQAPPASPAKRRQVSIRMSRLRLAPRRDDRNAAATRKVIADAATQNRLRWREAVRDPFLPS